MILYRPVSTLARPVIWLRFRPRVRGKQHLPRGGFVLAANHVSGFDALALGYALGLRPVRNMGKNQLFRRPLLGPFVRSLGAFPARDEEDLRGGVPAAAGFAQKGQVVAIFPEGARMRADREHRPRSGAAMTALQAGVPVVPAWIAGTDGWRERRPWSVTFGPAVDLDDLRAGEPSAGAREATRRLWAAIQALGPD